MDTLNQFNIKKGDTLPALKTQLIDRTCLGSKIPFSLTGVTGVTFTMKNECGDIKIMANNAEVVSYSGGVIQYNWNFEDTNDIGVFYGEFQLFFADGNRMSVPKIGSIKINIGNGVNPY
jgi:hypothetical protein